MRERQTSKCWASKRVRSDRSPQPGSDPPNIPLASILQLFLAQFHFEPLVLGRTEDNFEIDRDIVRVRSVRRRNTAGAPPRDHCQGPTAGTRADCALLKFANKQSLFGSKKEPCRRRREQNQEQDSSKELSDTEG